MCIILSVTTQFVYQLFHQMFPTKGLLSCFIQGGNDT